MDHSPIWAADSRSDRPEIRHLYVTHKLITQCSKQPI
jgi:hypothetical protein